MNAVVTDCKTRVRHVKAAGRHGKPLHPHASLLPPGAGPRQEPARPAEAGGVLRPVHAGNAGLLPRVSAGETTGEGEAALSVPAVGFAGVRLPRGHSPRNIPNDSTLLWRLAPCASPQLRRPVALHGQHLRRGLARPRHRAGPWWVLPRVPRGFARAGLRPRERAAYWV